MSLFQDFLRTTTNTVKNTVNKVADTKVPVAKLLPGPAGAVANVLPKKQPSVTPRKVLNTAADLTVRPVARVGFEIAQTISKDKKTYTPKGSVQKAILGSEPLRNYEDPNRTSAKVAKKVGLPKLGVPLAVAGAALDVTSLTPSGAGKGVAKKVISKAPRVLESAEAATKFGRELNLYKKDKAARAWADELKFDQQINRNLLDPKPGSNIFFRKVITPEGMEKLVRVKNAAAEKIQDIGELMQDERGFINFGAEIGKPKTGSGVKQSTELTKSSLNDVNPGQVEKVLDKPKIGTDIKLLGPGDPEARLREALTLNNKLRGKQEQSYTSERALRIQEAIKAGEEAGGGEAGLYAKKAKLAGEFQKVGGQDETLRSKISQSDLDGLIKKIDSSENLTDFEKIPASTALINLLDSGKIPTNSELEKLGQVFKRETIDALMETRSRKEKLLDLGVNIANVPRSLMSTADVSAPLRQGIVPAVSHPRDFGRSFKNMFKYAASEKAYQNLTKEIQSRPTYKLMREHKLALSSNMGAISDREEAFASELAERIPGAGRLVKGSSRAYTGFLNNFRADLFDTILKGNPKYAEDEKFVRDVASFVNNATGRGDLSKAPFIGKQLSEAAPLLNATFFSPRLIASRANFFNPVYYAKMHPAVRKEAAKQIVGFVGAGMSILGAAKLAGADVGTDPTSSDFGKIKVGDTRYDLWGGFQPYAVLIARTLLNKSTSSTTGRVTEFNKGYKPANRLSIGTRFLRSKLAPIPSYMVDVYSGKNQLGEDANPATEAVKRVTPLMWQDINDKIKEYGPAGSLLSIPGFFGVGTQTYGSTKPSNSSSAPIGTRLTR